MNKRFFHYLSDVNKEVTIFQPQGCAKLKIILLNYSDSIIFSFSLKKVKGGGNILVNANSSGSLNVYR